MRPFYPILPGLLLLVGFGLLPIMGSASETRVDSTGGLITVLKDETDDLNLFLDGNPAGLVLLNTRNRFDIAGEWSYSSQQGPWGSDKPQVFTSIPRYTDSPVPYEGLMLFPDPHWAVQVSGDVFYNQGVTVFSNDTETGSQWRELVRAAYAFPSASLGIELMEVESGKAYNAGLYNPYVGVASGNGSQDQLFLKTGFIATFPGPASPQDPRWQVGAYFLTQVGSSDLSQNLNVFYANSIPFQVGQTTTTTDYANWCGEFLWELPSIAKILLSASTIGSNTDFTQTVAYTTADFGDLAKYHLTDFQSVNVTGAFKLSLPYSDTENLKLGGSIAGNFDTQDVLTPAGTVLDNEKRSQIVTSLGIGLESPGEYTLGLQWKSLGYLGGSGVINNSGIQAPLSGLNYGYSQLAFGGEKWISPIWALRLGLVAEDDSYNASSVNTLTMTINAGAGLEKVFGRIDGRIWLGQASDLNNSSNTIGVIGAEVSTTFFL